MKKGLCLLLIIMMLLFTFTSCASEDITSGNSEESVAETTEGSLTGEPRLPGVEDIDRAVTITDVKVSPDGRSVMYEISEMPEEEGEARSYSTWIMDLSEETHDISSINEGTADQWSYNYSPDGTMISYMQYDDEHGTQIWVRSVDGQDVQMITDSGFEITNYKWSPDSKNIAFEAITEDNGPEEPSGVHIYTQADYNQDFTSSEIFYVSLESGETTQLTDSGESPMMAFWAKDSAVLYYSYYDENGDCFLSGLNVQNGESSEGMSIDAYGGEYNLGYAPEYVLSPDGTKAAYYEASPTGEWGFQQDEIFVLDLNTGEIAWPTKDYDYEVGYGGIYWADNDTLIAVNTEKSSANLVSLDLKTNQINEIWKDTHSIYNLGASDDGEVIIVNETSFTSPQELYQVSRDGSIMKLTSYNDQLKSELILSSPEEIEYETSDGYKVHGYLQYPADFDKNKKYPMIVMAHGGPFYYFPSAYNATVQAMAADGYFVMLVNPRGSQSYGEKFAQGLAEGYPGPDFEDYMAGVDYLLDKYPFIDGDNLALTGGSAGGILTDYAITQTNRFKAAVSVSDIADFNQYTFVGDQFYQYSDTEPWLNEGDEELSPINHVHGGMKTPTMFIAGTADKRCPPESGGKMMFRALKYYGVPTAYISFDGADHVIYTSDDARHYRLSIYYTLRWMDHFIKGIETPEFEGCDW